METEWAENRAKIPQDGLRRLLDKVGLGGIYSTSERDKFIIRIEQSKNGTTDVFFAHKGMKEVYADKNKDTTTWQPAANDPNLEAAFLARFMQYMGVDQQQAENALTQSVAKRSGNDLARIDGNTLLVSGDYGRNWRRTALALDRIGLNVLGQNMERHAFHWFNKAPTESESRFHEKTGLLRPYVGQRQKSRKTLPPIPNHSYSLNLSTAVHASAS